MLSEDQKSIIFEYQRSKQEELCRDLEARVRMKLSENPNNERQVTPILKVYLPTYLNLISILNSCIF